MRRVKQCVSLIAAAALVVTSLPANGLTTIRAGAEETDTTTVSVDKTIKLTPTEASTFNDTNGDGLGEFEGWGTSLCWWANRIGYSEDLTSEAAKLFFSSDGLNMNIGRYNVGGGDDVTDEEITYEEVSVNENAVIYDLETEGYTPSYSGSSMSVGTLTGLADATYLFYDADFGLTKGDTVGNLTYIGWINGLDGEVGSGDNLHYTVNASEAGSYTVKLLLTLTGTNSRDVAIRVNGTTDYIVDSETINSNIIATSTVSSTTYKLFVVEINDVQLAEGDNTVNIGGSGTDWTLDFVRMAVIPDGLEGTAPEVDEYLHSSHIIRSDSAVPGYCVDVTKMDLDNNELSYYEKNFDAADEESGYAWNYDWSADSNQVNVLKAAIEAYQDSNADEDETAQLFLAEAFSNSPPYFMTVSGCSSGNTDSSVDNLRSDCYTAFATYMADVIEHLISEGLEISSTDPMNEPYTDYWGAYSNKQEGCHFDIGTSQSEIIIALNEALEERGINIIISASDETSIDTAITAYNALSDEAQEIVDRIDTHTYSGSDRAGLNELAESEGKNLWMSEVDGAYTGGGSEAGEMSAAIGLATRMITDVSGLECSAWILWNAIDMHSDSSEEGQSWVAKGSANDYLSMDALEAAWGSTTSNGYWGLAAADHDTGEIVLSMKYYAYGQFSRYIRPGYTIIGSGGNTLAAYDSENDRVVIVAVNNSNDDKTWKFDLSGFETIGTTVTAIRTSGSLESGEKWADVTDSDNISVNTDENYFTATLLGNSITTYTIEGVSGILPATSTDYPAIRQITVTADQVTGEKVWNNGTVNVATNVVDGDFSTFFDGVNTDSGEQGYVILDLGEATEIAAIGYAPRSNYADRCVDAEIYGSLDGETWTLLYTIEETPAVGENTIVYYMDFNSASLESWRYIKFTRDSECNLSELNVWELAPTIESQEAVAVSVYDEEDFDLDTIKLPDTVSVTLDNGETEDVSVTWDLSDVDLSDLTTLYDSIEVTGTSSDANGTVTGHIVYAPDNLEYLIDCMTGDSPVAVSQKGTTYTSDAWTAVQGLSTLLNKDSSDQLKTADNTWGLVSTDNINCWDWDYTGDGGHLYGYGYWAGSDADIEYELTLPAGTHEITLGCFDYWSGRTMNVYYTAGEETELLTTLTSYYGTPNTATATITLKEETVVKISVQNGGDGDPVLSMISVVKVPTSDETALTAHYDMSHSGGALTDISGNGNDATLYDTEDSDFASYNGEDVLQFNNRQYATIPSGVITDAASFTVQAVVSAQTNGDNWVWTIGDGIGSWGAGDISDYIFVAANSSQGSYSDTVLAAVKVGLESSGGESRMDVPTATLGAGFTTITLVSDGDTLTLYMDGEVVSTLTHEKDLSDMIPDGDILGYIGKSLYSTDAMLIANVADIMIWDTALTASELEMVAPAETDGTNMILADIRKAMLNGNASEDEITSDIALPTTMDGYDLTWTVSCSDGSVSETGAVTVPVSETDGAADVTVSFGDGLSAAFSLTIPATDVDTVLEEAAAEVTIPDADDIRGNITLISETSNGAAVTWTASDDKIVDVESHENEDYDDTPAGTVTRPEKDTVVVMTATISYTVDGETYTTKKQIEITVKAAAEAINEDDYTDYLFAYFAGEGYSDGENIFLASSEDGLNWDDLNNNEAVLTSEGLGEDGARDPFIIRSPEGDKFYLIATDLKIYGNNDWTAAQESGSQSLLVWESTDLVNWSEPRLVEVSADINAGCTWAPEVTYDETTGEYVVYWASKVADDDYALQRVYYAKTRDFYTFTEPEVFIDNDNDSSIDTTIIQGDDGYFYRITKNESDNTNDQGALTKTVYIERSKTLLGDYELVTTNLNEFQWVEGPAIFKFNSDDADVSTWCLLVDEYSGVGYYPLITTTLDISADETTFAAATDYVMPTRARHGTVLNITSDEYAALVAAYGTPDEVETATYQGEIPDLPDTVTMGGEEYAVTWETMNANMFSGDFYSYVEVTGTLDADGRTATATVQIIPDNIEYMIDCNSGDSVTWQNALALNSGLLNADAADQAKTDENSWGYSSSLGTTNNDGNDMVAYGTSDSSTPYSGGYWAEDGMSISYQVTLPAGDHTILLGGTDSWWSGWGHRSMTVYVTVGDGEKTELCDFIVSSGDDEAYSQGFLSLDETAVVTISIENNNPILSWIAVTECDYSELEALIEEAEALTESDYTASSYAKVTAAVEAAKEVILAGDSQENIDAAAQTLKAAISGLVDLTVLQNLYDAYKDVEQGDYTDEEYAEIQTALSTAAKVLADGEATQSEVNAAYKALYQAVTGRTLYDAVSEDDIIANDYVLYLVNCGTPDSSVVPTDSTLGLYQSNVWQQYAADATTGYNWGYAEDTAYSVIVSGGSDATSLTSNYIYMGTSVTRVDGETGFTFTFDLPDRESGSTLYEVVVGVQNPWDTRSLTVSLEGEEMGSMSLTKGSLVEETFTVNVTDNELNVFLNNPGNTSQYADPVLSYVIVKAVPVADAASLLALIEKYDAAIAENKEAGNSYTDGTMTIYETARDQAKSVLNDSTASATEIQEAMDILTDAYEALVIIYNYTSITGTNGDVLYDNNGVAIQAHGGQIVKWGDTYYWYGEDKSNDYRPVVGVHLYTSTDLYNWTDCGVVLKSMPVADEDYEADIADDPDTNVDASMDEIFGENRETDYYYDLYYEKYKDMDSEYEMYNEASEKYSGKLVETFWNLAEDRCVIERPKVLYNEETGMYVMWFHSDGRTPESTADYGKAMAGVAICDTPDGDFTLLGTYTLAYDEDAHDYDGNWDSEGGHVRDMTVFQDDDGTAYVLYSSEGNAVMYIAELNDEYTGLVKDADEMVLGEDFNIISTNSREAPAIFKENGIYYVITSGTNGWNPTQSQYSIATDLMGEWTAMGDPFVDDGSGETYTSSSYSFGSQSTYVIDMGDGTYIYMGDRWYATSSQSAYYYIGNLRDSRYIWLPIEFGTNGTISISNYSDWTLDVLSNLGAITVNTALPESAGSLDELAEALPDTLDVTIGDTDYESAAVEWSYDDSAALGYITVTGTLTDIGRSFTITVLLYSDSLIYFADCYTGGDTGITSDAYELLSGYSKVIRNTVSDRAYGDDYGYSWGYTSSTGASGSSSSQDMGSKDNGGDFYDCGWWATSNGTITYQFDIDPGSYTVVTGYAEWWSTTRYMEVTVSAVDASGNETKLNSSTFTLSSSGTGMQVLTEVEVPDDAVAITVSVDKTSGSDAVLSWIGIIDSDGSGTGYSDELLTDGSFEDQNADGAWSLGNGASIVSGDAVDGIYYLQEDGSANSWGSGSSQTISVEPETTYILSGSAYATGSGYYYAGANVDGREIYDVFTAGSSATYEDTESKYTSTAHTDLTGWTDFSIEFTTGEDTTSISIYTWTDYGTCGYLDNVSLVAVVDTGLDWTYFDSVVEAAEALNEEDYTADTWAALKEALASAKEFKENADSDTTRKEMITVAAALQAAMDDLIGINDPLGGEIYYVDAVNGSDDNDGLTPDTAWKTLTKASSVRWLNTGGAILLKAGCIWNGEQLVVEGATGTEGDPIVIGSYYVDGDGEAVVGVPEDGTKPVVNGNGGNWSYSTMADLAAVHIKNCENIVIENLEITNWDSSVGEVGSAVQSSRLLSGLVVENCDAGELENTVIRNNEIHDVNGLMAGGSQKAAGGLIVVVTGSGTNHTGSVESWYSGLTIEGNEVYDVCHEAIYMESVWASRTLVGGTSSDTSYQNAGNSDWIGSSEVLIQNNYVHDVAGDGIVPINTTDCLVQYNLVDNAADTNWDYSNNPNHAAIWTWDSDNVTFRYNEASNTSKDSYGTAVGNDSMAFDFDYGVQNCTYEYNYSHDNLGGFLMLCPGPGATVNNIARYNISVNDGRYSGAPILRLGTGKYGSIGVQIYNNTAYWEGNGGYALSLASDSYWEGSVIENVSVFNNIFYGPVTSGSVSTQDGVDYYNNIVYSTDGSAWEVYSEAADDDTSINADPMFTDVTDYTAGSWADGTTTLGTADGFRITADSPAIDAGADIPEAPNYSTSSIGDELVTNTTEAPATDYYGAELSDGKIDIGASEFETAKTTATDTLVVRRGENIYYFQETLDSTTAFIRVEFGDESDEYLTGDWDGDGIDSLCIRIGNTYYFQTQPDSDEIWASVTFGRATDEVIAGDWDGDGDDELAVKRGCKFYFQADATSDEISDTIDPIYYGRTDDTVIAGDWDGNGCDELAVKRGNRYYFQTALTETNGQLVDYGRVSDVPIVGDWDGNGCDELVVKRGNRYYFQENLYETSGRLVDYGRADDVTMAGTWQ